MTEKKKKKKTIKTQFENHETVKIYSQLSHVSIANCKLNSLKTN